MCEEVSRANGSGHRGSRAKTGRCHRYYCPFAHSQQELRTSPIAAEMRDQLIQRACETFSRDDCCQVCPPSRVQQPIDGSHGIAMMPFSSRGNQQNHPQDGAAHSPQPLPQMYAMPSLSALQAQAALSDGQDGMAQKDGFIQTPYIANLQNSPQIMAFRQAHWAQADTSSFLHNAPLNGLQQGCGMVVNQQGQAVPQEVMHHGGQAPTTASTPPPQHMVMVQGSPLGMPGAIGSPQHPNAGQMSMAHMMLTPQGMVTGVGDHSNGQMPVMQVTPLQTNQGERPDFRKDLSTILRNAGLERFTDVFAQAQLQGREAVLAMTAHQLGNLGMNAVEQSNFKYALEEFQKAEHAGMVMMQQPANGLRTPNMGAQLVIVPGYGCYAASPQPTPEGMQTLGYPNVSMPWSPQQMLGGYMPQVQSEQRSDQARQPGYQPPGNSVQQVQPQQQENVVFMQHSLPPVPPFPVQTSQPQQIQQPVHQMQLMPNQVNQQCEQVPSQPQGLPLSAPPGASPQMPHGAIATTQQHHIPHYGNAPAEPPQQNLPPGNLQPHVSSSQATPPPSDDSPQSLDVDSQANGNGHGNGDLKSDRNSKRRAKKQEGSSFMRTVEKLLEASDPPVLTVDELHKRIQAQGPQGESPATIPRLLQHLKALPERFLVDGQQVALVRFAHREEVQNILKAAPAKATRS